MSKFSMTQFKYNYSDTFLSLNSYYWCLLFFKLRRLKQGWIYFTFWACRCLHHFDRHFEHLRICLCVRLACRHSYFAWFKPPAQSGKVPIGPGYNQKGIPESLNFPYRFLIIRVMDLILDCYIISKYDCFIIKIAIN